MKRINHLHDSIYNLENLRLADQRARKGKAHQYGIKVFDRDREGNLISLSEELKNKTYRTGKYTIRKIYEPKERIVYKLAYKHRVVHHAIMNILEPYFVSTFTADTYSCIKGKGVHAASYALRDALKDKEATTYCLKLDIRKFYENIDHSILKQLLRRKFKDNDLHSLLGEIIDSAPGLPIGNYLSQYFANFYLAYFDHWIKEQMEVVNYFRYADDIVIVASSKEYLHKLLYEIRRYLWENLKLTIKDNYQVFPVEARGIDFCGYVHFHDVVYIRPSILKRAKRALKYRRSPGTISGYNGWFKHANCINLKRKLYAN